ncbi:MAG: alpha/beta fold hydrolase [Endozoicomonas sp. (ex Botrylloides leachii)]|nr:alpha/beta fold hydrolase [Endozoicomonas sp. (ex Botrylloides leachii)]
MKLDGRQQGEGADVISLHGLFGTKENLGGINKRLADFFRVHSLDIRNHGRSPHADEMDYDHMVADIIEYMNDQQLETVDLAGHSMGGKIAMAIALKIPERIRKVVVLDIAPVTYKRKHNHILNALSSINITELNSRADADKLLATYVDEKDIRQFLLKNIYRNAAGHYQWRMNLNAIKKNYSNIMAGQSSDKPFIGDILFLKASESDYILPEHRLRVLSLFPNACMKIISGTGHWLHAQKPELISRFITQFFLATPS